jgi:hypothetical protein
VFSRLLICCFLIFGVGATEAADRRLGLAMADLETRPYDQAVVAAKRAGVTFTSIPLQWDEIETAPGVYAPEVDWLSIASEAFPQLGLDLALEINPIDTNRDRRPSWLQGKAWDDPEVVASFERLVRHLMKKSSGLEIVTLSLGNEVDGLLGSDQAQWLAYGRLLEAGRAAARDVRGGIKTGVKITYAGVMGDARTHARALGNNLDVTLITYYPLNANFTARPVAQSLADFEMMSAIFAGREIHLAEIGYPSGEECSDGEAAQAAFVDTVFQFWANHVDQFKSINWTWMTDVSDAEVSAATAQYGVSSPCFQEYFATLGLERRDLTPKAAWQAFVRHGRELAERN